MKVRPKKFLGQHFLKDQNIALKIVEALKLTDTTELVVEIGPGMGVLTQFLITKPNVDLRLIEIDRESVAYLKVHFPTLTNHIIEGDFLEMNMNAIASSAYHIIGNFPYNISSQIFFRVLEQRGRVKQVVCMLQKEVADRIAEKEGSKTYGILSVLLQAYYDIEYLFKVSPGVFHPAPQVMSAVIRLTRNSHTTLGCNEDFFQRIVKQAFQNRRKTLRNALKPLNLNASMVALPLLDKRAEQLSVQQFIDLTKKIEETSENIC